MDLVKKRFLIFFIFLLVFSHSFLKAEEEDILLQAVADQIQVLVKDLKTLDTVIMFVPNEKALELPDKGGLKLVEYALSKKVTLCGPSMLFLIFKVVEYFWKADKQSKNIMDVIELANKISTQRRKSRLKTYHSCKGSIFYIK